MNKKLAVGIMLVFVAIVFLILISYSVASDGGEDTRAGGNYVGSDQCITCHGSQHAGWSLTLHPNAWDTLNNSSQMVPECRKCHVTGYGETSIGGFDPSTNLPLTMQSVQCEACHGPGEDHVGSQDKSDIFVSYSAYVCGAICHQQEHHPYYEEWNLSGHSMSLLTLKGAGDAAEDACLECHSADYYLTGRQRTIDTAEYSITCSRCHDPHDATNQNQLRMPIDELCDSCHNPSGAIPGDPIYHPQSSMRDGTSGVPVTGSPFMPGVECADCHIYGYIQTNITGHSFTPKAEACVVCHQTTPPFYSNETAQVVISNWNSHTWNRALEVQGLLVIAKGSIDNAVDLGFSTAVIDSANALYEEADYSLTFVVADGSGGAHNPEFASDLLNYSESKSQEIMSLLRTGNVIGKVVDESGSAVEGVAVYMDGELKAVSGSTGVFTFSHASGTYDLTLKLAGSKVGSVDSVEITAGQDKDLGEITISEDSVFVYFMIAIVMVFFFAIILIYMLTRRKRETVEEPEEEETEPEEG
jgi:predicted CXXCH cytochrome family protein